MEAEPAAGAAAMDAAGAGADASAAPVVRSFTFTPISGDWADDAEEEDGEGREGERASALEQLKEKYQHRCAHGLRLATRAAHRVRLAELGHARRACVCSAHVRRTAGAERAAVSCALCVCAQVFSVRH
jgi:hypothetical protein